MTPEEIKRVARDVIDKQTDWEVSDMCDTPTQHESIPTRNNNAVGTCRAQVKRFSVFGFNYTTSWYELAVYANGALRSTHLRDGIDDDILTTHDIPFDSNITTTYQERNGAVYVPSQYGLYRKKYKYSKTLNSLKTSILDSDVQKEIQEKTLGLVYSGGCAEDFSVKMMPIPTLYELTPPEWGIIWGTSRCMTVKEYEWHNVCWKNLCLVTNHTGQCVYAGKHICDCEYYTSIKKCSIKNDKRGSVMMVGCAWDIAAHMLMILCNTDRGTKFLNQLQGAILVDKNNKLASIKARASKRVLKRTTIEIEFNRPIVLTVCNLPPDIAP